MSSFDVLVRGAGIVGRSLALALSRQGFSVALQAAAPAASGPDVRTYALNLRSVQLLRELRVWDALPRDAATAVLDMRVMGDAHASRLDFSAWAQHVDALAWIVDAAALEETLATAVRFAPHVTALDAADAQPSAALRALCDGKFSGGRAELGVDWQADRYGQTAVAARLVSDLPHGGMARQWFRAPDILALLPFDRPTSGRSYGLVWSLPDARAQELLSADPAVFEAALNEATAGAAGTLSLSGERAGWPLMLGRASRTHGPGWVLLGDAAHVVHPLAGQGLNLGLADVAALADVVAAREPFRTLGDERLLARWARRRAVPNEAMARVTDGLLHLFSHPAPWVRELRNRGLTLVNHATPFKRLLTARAIDA